MIALLAVSAALAGPCDGLYDGMPDGLVSPFLHDGGLGRAHSACARTELGLGANGYLVVDTPNFYGNIVAAGVVDGRARLTDAVELFGSIELVRYDSVIGALSSSTLGPGHTAVGASGRVWANDTTQVAVNGKLVLPTAFLLYQHSWPVGADLGVAMAWSKSAKFRVDAQVGGLGSGAISGAGAQPRAGAQAHAGVEWRPVKPLGLVAGLDAGFAYEAPVDHVAAQIGLRTHLGRRGGLELAGVVPFAGRERALASVALRGNVRFGKLPEPPASQKPVVPIGATATPK